MATPTVRQSGLGPGRGEWSTLKGQNSAPSNVFTRNLQNNRQCKEVRDTEIPSSDPGGRGSLASGLGRRGWQSCQGCVQGPAAWHLQGLSTSHSGEHLDFLVPSFPRP